MVGKGAHPQHLSHTCLNPDIDGICISLNMATNDLKANYLIRSSGEGNRVWQIKDII